MARYAHHIPKTVSFLFSWKLSPLSFIILQKQLDRVDLVYLLSTFAFWNMPLNIDYLLLFASKIGQSCIDYCSAPNGMFLTCKNLSLLPIDYCSALIRWSSLFFFAKYDGLHLWDVLSFLLCLPLTNLTCFILLGLPVTESDITWSQLHPSERIYWYILLFSCFPLYSSQ